jgi:hypothetical protein
MVYEESALSVAEMNCTKTRHAKTPTPTNTTTFTELPPFNMRSNTRPRLAIVREIVATGVAPGLMRSSRQIGFPEVPLEVKYPNRSFAISHETATTTVPAMTANSRLPYHKRAISFIAIITAHGASTTTRGNQTNDALRSITRAEAREMADG